MNKITCGLTFLKDYAELLFIIPNHLATYGQARDTILKKGSEEIKETTKINKK